MALFEFGKTMLVSASGMRAQGERMRVIAENMANANAVPQAADVEPYRRKVPTFRTVLDRETGVQTVQVGRIVPDMSEFQKRYDPGHPGADRDGYVRMPNINTLIEMVDMREAQRSYEANLTVIEGVKQMLGRTIDLLRA